jgi:hypothetical protein
VMRIYMKQLTQKFHVWNPLEKTNTLLLWRWISYLWLSPPPIKPHEKHSMNLNNICHLGTSMNGVENMGWLLRSISAANRQQISQNWRERYITPMCAFCLRNCQALCMNLMHADYWVSHPIPCR